MPIQVNLLAGISIIQKISKNYIVYFLGTLGANYEMIFFVRKSRCTKGSHSGSISNVFECFYFSECGFRVRGSDTRHRAYVSDYKTTPAPPILR